MTPGVKARGRQDLHDVSKQQNQAYADHEMRHGITQKYQEQSSRYSDILPVERR